MIGMRSERGHSVTESENESEGKAWGHSYGAGNCNPLHFLSLSLWKQEGIAVESVAAVFCGRRLLASLATGMRPILGTAHTELATWRTWRA